MSLKDLLGLVLRENALELAAAVDALEARDADLRQIRAVHAGAPDVLGGLEERRQQPDRVQDLKGARLDRCRARLAVQPHLPFDGPYASAIAEESSAATNRPEGPAPIIKTSFGVIQSPNGFEDIVHSQDP
jgi:hypothetical protein